MNLFTSGSLFKRHPAQDSTLQEWIDMSPSPSAWNIKLKIYYQIEKSSIDNAQRFIYLIFPHDGFKKKYFAKCKRKTDLFTLHFDGKFQIYLCQKYITYLSIYPKNDVGINWIVPGQRIARVEVRLRKGQKQAKACRSSCRLSNL